MSVLQAVLVGILYYLSDAPFFFGEGYYVLQRPVVAGFLVGLVMGHPVQGAIIGATINLIYLGHLNVGGSMPSDMALAGYIGTAIAISQNIPTETALALAVPLGLLGTIWWVGKMTVDSFFVHWQDKYAAEGNAKGVMLMGWLPCQLMMFCLKMVVTLVICLAGAEGVGAFLSAIEGTRVLTALNVVGGVLPALGIALNLRAILKKETVPFLLIGFVLISYFSETFSIVGVAVLGGCFAAIYMFYDGGLGKNTGRLLTQNEPVEAEEKPEQRVSLTKKDINKSYWIWQFFSHANYNYERMQGGSFAMSMIPILEKLYPNDKEKMKEGLQRHMVFFNTNPNFGTLAHGATIAMEEQRANGADIDDNAINSVKTGLMGPLAGIGDTLDQGIIIPLIVAIGISIASAGNVAGSLLVLITLPIILMLIAHFFYVKGYQMGSNAVTALLQGGQMKRIITAASILGCTVMGALISNYVSLSVPITFTISQEEFNLQTGLFDAIMPNLLPLLLTLGVFRLLGKEKWTSLKVMLLLIVCAFVGGMIGLFG